MPRSSRLLLVSLAALGLQSGCAQVTTVVLVRHAEKVVSKEPDPQLTPRGEERARALVEVTRGSGAVAIYHTQYERTRQTAQPSADALGLPMTRIDVPRGGVERHARAVVSHILSNHGGETVVVVGHSNTVPALIAELGVPSPPAIPESDYDDLFVVVRRGATGKLIHARYGP